MLDFNQKAIQPIFTGRRQKCFDVQYLSQSYSSRLETTLRNKNDMRNLKKKLWMMWKTFIEAFLVLMWVKISSRHFLVQDDVFINLYFDRRKKWRIILICNENIGTYMECIPEKSIFRCKSKIICSNRKRWMRRFRRFCWDPIKKETSAFTRKIR